jgi:hypothetical protein
MEVRTLGRTGPTQVCYVWLMILAATLILFGGTAYSQESPSEQRSLGEVSQELTNPVSNVIDGVYEFIVFRRFYPGEALQVAIVLAIVPYLLIRGLANRIARHNIKSKGRESNPVVTLSMRVGSAIRWHKNGRKTS